jgi:hypothetical protein
VTRGEIPRAEENFAWASVGRRGSARSPERSCDGCEGTRLALKAAGRTVFELSSATSLGTTNVFVGVLAVVSVLEALLLAVFALAAWKIYGRSLAAIADARQRLEPLAARVNELAGKVEAIADDVKDVTSVARRTVHLYGIGRGVRAAYQSFVRRDASRGGTKED